MNRLLIHVLAVGPIYENSNYSYFEFGMSHH